MSLKNGISCHVRVYHIRQERKFKLWFHGDLRKLKHSTKMHCEVAFGAIF